VDSFPVRLHALVTGASRGIGRAIAQQLAARGCRVVVHYHQNRAAAETTLASLAGDGHALVAADVASEHGVAHLWREATTAVGRVDILVNNAGIYVDHPPLATNTEHWMALWRDTLAANLLAPALLCHLAVTAMAQATPTANASFGRGRIVNISSRGAFRGEPHAPAYGASKAGLNALSQSLARALAGDAIYVFCLAPGWVDTEMAADYLNGPRRDEILSQHPLGRVATADEVARAAVFCALDAPATMTGGVIDINGASYLRT
jgi:NAD(P)-dependent dehydrogenase (short-subunit alcohol dehydrogenase family)